MLANADHGNSYQHDPNWEVKPPITREMDPDVVYDEIRNDTDTYDILDAIKHDFEGYPLVYPITVYYLYPIVVAGRVVHVLWYIIGCIGNTLSMRIWANPRMKRINASALYLVAVTICDIAYQILHVFSYLKYFWGLPALGATGLCETWNVLNLIPQYASQLFVMAFTIERFISIYSPFQSERFSRRLRAPREITAITIFTVAVALPQAYFWTVRERGFCEARGEEHVLHVFSIWTWVTEMLFFAFVPVVTLILNLFVLHASQKSAKQHQQSMTSRSNGEPRIHHKGKTCRPSTITLLQISFFRIFTQLPVTITYSLQNMRSTDFGPFTMRIKDFGKDEQWNQFFIYWGARLIIEMIGVSHHALSVFVFYASTKQFRMEIRLILRSFKRCVLRRKDDGHFDLDQYKSASKHIVTTTTTLSSSPPGSAPPGPAPRRMTYPSLPSRY